MKKQNRIGSIILSRDIIYDSFAKTTFFPQRCDSSVGYSTSFLCQCLRINNAALFSRMAALIGHWDFRNWTGDSIWPQVWLGAGNSKTVSLIVAISVLILSPIIVSGNLLVFFSTWKEPSEEALVMAITLYYIIDGSCWFHGWVRD